MITEQYIHSVILKKEIPHESYLSNLPAVKYLTNKKELLFDSNVTFLVGENGTGKSTLIEAIAVAYGFNPEGGTKNFNFSTVNAHSDLWKYISLIKKRFPKDGFFLRAESFFNVASNIDELDKSPFGNRIINSYGGVSLHEQSHGESFLALMNNRFAGNGIYILDEPEAAMSPKRLLTIIALINKLVKNNSQFIIATHSPILLAFPKAKIYELSDKGIRNVNFKETEHYQITRRFLENPEKMLKYLLDD